MKEIENLPISPTSTTLSGASTIAEQQQAGLRAPRSDIGVQRAPYKTKKKMEKEQKQLVKSLTPEERRLFFQSPSQQQTREQALNEILQRRGNRTLQDIQRELQGIEEEPMAKTSAPKRGTGLKRIKPPKRQVRTNKEELMKNRLRLVASQIEAGNTNPKLIKEVNELYKKLYDIDNAYMLLKK
jgi:hypothetical protein